MLRLLSDHPPRIDGYSDLREIGSGGFSRVYEAHQREFGRQVAVKVLNSRLVDEAGVAAFERECRSMGVLSMHPNIVTVLASAFTSDKRPCIVMDLFPGGDYMSSLRTRGPVPLADLLSLGVRMSGALATAHEHGVVHGDVKPQNIFKSNFGDPALGDFGIATLYGPGADQAPVGLSAHYAAPELIESGTATTGPASDQYALAATIFTLATGRRPFESDVKETPQQVILRALSEPVPRLPGRFPRALGDVLLRAMARDPNRRYPDLAALGSALAEVERALGYQVTRLPLGGVEDEAPAVASPFADDQSMRPPAASTPAAWLGTGDARESPEPDAGDSVTMLRRLPQPAEEPEAEQEADDEDESDLRRTLVAAGAAVAVLVIAGIIVLTLGFRGDVSDATITATTVAGPPPSLPPPPPPAPPQGITGTLESGVATFTWDAPSTGGFTYQVVRLDDAARDVPTMVNRPEIVFRDLAAEEHPCVQVQGRESARNDVTAVAARLRRERSGAMTTKLCFEDDDTLPDLPWKVPTPATPGPVDARVIGPRRGAHPRQSAWSGKTTRTGSAIEDATFVVADGMGGLDGGAEAAESAVEAALTRALSLSMGASLAHWRYTVRLVNEDVRIMMRDRGLHQGRQHAHHGRRRVVTGLWPLTWATPGCMSCRRVCCGSERSTTICGTSSVTAVRISRSSRRVASPWPALTSYIGQSDEDLRGRCLRLVADAWHSAAAVQ